MDTAVKELKTKTVKASTEMLAIVLEVLDGLKADTTVDQKLLKAGRYKMVQAFSTVSRAIGGKA